MTRLRKTKKSITAFVLMLVGTISGLVAGMKAVETTSETEYSYDMSDILPTKEALADTYNYGGGDGRGPEQNGQAGGVGGIF